VINWSEIKDEVLENLGEVADEHKQLAEDVGKDLVGLLGREAAGEDVPDAEMQHVRAAAAALGAAASHTVLNVVLTATGNALRKIAGGAIGIPL
jgi:hypothetical protein